jgi:hypothetical protein
MRLFIFLGMALLAGFLSFLVGLKLGEHESGPYDPNVAGAHYLFANVRMRDTPSGATEASVEAGAHRYTYAWPADQLTPEWNVDQLGRGPHRRKWTSEELEKISTLAGVNALAEGGLIAVLTRAGVATEAQAAETAAAAGKGRDWRMVALVTASAFGGGIIGYLAGRKDEINLDAEGFQQQLQDKSLWRTLAKFHQKCAPLLAAVRARTELDVPMEGKLVHISSDGSLMRKDPKYAASIKMCEALGAGA